MEGVHLETREERIEEGDEIIRFMSGLEGYIDEIETEERRAKKLRDRQRIQTVSSDDDDEDESITGEDENEEWEDCSDSDDSDDSECNNIIRKYLINQMYDSDDVGFDEDGRSFIVKNGYRMYSDGEYEYEYDRDIYWD